MIQEKVIPQMFVASSLHYVKCITDDLIEKFTNDFEKHLMKTGAKETETQNFLTVFHVDEYTDKDYNMELWIQIEELKKDTDDVQFKSIPECEVVYILVYENYENLRTSYDALFQYVQDNDYIVNGYPRETYLFDEKAPYGYFTEIQLPFTRKIN